MSEEGLGPVDPAGDTRARLRDSRALYLEHLAGVSLAHGPPGGKWGLPTPRRGTPERQYTEHGAKQTHQ